MQGLADARIPPRHLARTYMAIRTFPIRVGNIDGHSSGDWYPDQYETSWAALNIKPELTTVTQRIRRVASFSIDQFYDACYANDPDFVFVSHMDYLDPYDREEFLDNLRDIQHVISKPVKFLLGFGPQVQHIAEGV
jgi:adenylosuccinate synthase